MLNLKVGFSESSGGFKAVFGENGNRFTAVFGQLYEYASKYIFPEPITRAEYEALAEAGKLSDKTYYFISG